jgi:hypothetical protein
MDVVTERNLDEYGAYTHGTNIPAVSKVDSSAMKPNYYRVLPWHFKIEFLDRVKETLGSGIGIIFPLLNVEIIKY